MLTRSLLIIALTHIGWLASAQNEDFLKYIDKYYEIAVQEMERAGIPASIKLAQGILESDAGRSELARRANNHFGIKCGSNWKGKTVYREDDDYDDRGKLIKSCFRAYRTDEASYIAHSEFLLDPRKNFRYGFLFRLDPTDYRAWAYGLKKAGYATSATYPEKLISLIDRYELHKYDLMTNLETGLPGSLEPVAVIMRINDVRYVMALEGETLADVAERTDVALRNLLNYNEKLERESQALPAGAQVFLQPKRNSYRGREKYHTVEAGESMFDISQQYGVKLEKLYKRNRLSEGAEPAVGAQIKLRGWKVREAPKVRSKFEEEPMLDILVPDEDEDGLLDMDEEDEIEITPTTPPPTRPGTVPVEPEDITPVVIPDLPPVEPEVTPETPTLPDDPFEDDRFEEVTPPPAPPTVTETYHTVVKGDTLYNISRRYNLSVDELKRLNNLSSNTISIGQRIRVK